MLEQSPAWLQPTYARSASPFSKIFFQNLATYVIIFQTFKSLKNFYPKFHDFTNFPGSVRMLLFANVTAAALLLGMYQYIQLQLTG